MLRSPDSVLVARGAASMLFLDTVGINSRNRRRLESFTAARVVSLRLMRAKIFTEGEPSSEFSTFCYHSKVSARLPFLLLLLLPLG